MATFDPADDTIVLNTAKSFCNEVLGWVCSIPSDACCSDGAAACTLARYRNTSDGPQHTDPRFSSSANSLLSTEQFESMVSRSASTASVVASFFVLGPKPHIVSSPAPKEIRMNTHKDSGE